MTFLQMILVALIPAGMIIYGKWTRKRRAPMKNFKISFMTRRTVRSNEAWNYAHSLFSNLMFVIGINVFVCSEAFYLAVRIFKNEAYWICVGALAAAQILGVLMGYFFCSWMVRRVYDINGDLIDPYAEEEENEEDGGADGREAPEPGNAEPEAGEAAGRLGENDEEGHK
ncbi:MAG: SdpI family protein [Clostridia bacterium]|nr:SdpI family protein [Clostridia bacterium]